MLFHSVDDQPICWKSFNDLEIAVVGIALDGVFSFLI
jgi:hypothetical protein